MKTPHFTSPLHCAGAALIAIALLRTVSAKDFAGFDKAEQKQLQNGDTVTWCVPFGAKKSCIVKSAILLNAPQEQVWTLLDDKEAAPSYIGDLQSCKILATEGNVELIQQETRPPGVPKSFTYLLNYRSQCPDRMDFTRHSGDLQHIEGSWEFVPVENNTKTLVTYALHIDPGKLVPKQMICRQQKKRLPAVLVAVRAQLNRMPSTENMLCCGKD